MLWRPVRVNNLVLYYFVDFGQALICSVNNDDVCSKIFCFFQFINYVFFETRIKYLHSTVSSRFNKFHLSFPFRVLFLLKVKNNNLFCRNVLFLL